MISSDPQPKDKAWLHAAWLVLYLLIALFGRITLGADQDDFGAFEDEPAHLVTAAMMRSYATSFDPVHPLRFVEEYYLHYPKVAAGQWPPVLHLLLGAVMIPLGVTPFGVLVGTCLVAALAAWSVRILARTSMPIPLPGILGLLFLGLPIVQQLAGAAMTELLVAAIGAFAVFHYGDYLQTGSRWRAVAFGVLAVLAILTKGNGLGLILVPILAPIFVGRWNRMFTWGTVFSGVLVGGVGYLWYSHTMQFSQSTWASQDSDVWYYLVGAASFYSSEMGLMIGSLALGLALIGMVVGMLDRGTRDQTAAGIAWLVGLTLCYLFLRTGIEARHLAATLPILIVFSGRGALWLWRYLGWSPEARGIPAAALLCTGLALQSYTPVRSTNTGYRETVDWLVQQPEFLETPWLIASDATGEGLLVAEAVLQDPRHKQLQVLRASKVLAKDDWLGEGYLQKYPTEQELLDFLARVPVGVIVLDCTQSRRQWFPHNELLRSVLEGHPERFEARGSFDRIVDGVPCKGGLRVYYQRGAEHMPKHPLTLEDVLSRTPSK